MKKIIYSVFVMMLTLVSCVDKDFDEPPIGGLDPAGVTANTTIAQVKTFFAGNRNQSFQNAAADSTGAEARDV